jgi:uridine phosphorylase
MTNPIAESEMILNDRGAIYHLDLLPEEIAPLVITVGDPARVKEVSKHFDRIEYQTAHREFLTHTGLLGNKRISVTSTGIGPDNIDIVLNELDALVNLDFQTRQVRASPQTLTIVRMGTCGGLQPDIPTDGLIISSHGLGLDNLLHYYSFTQEKKERNLLKAFSAHVGLNPEVFSPYLAAGDAQLLQAFVSHGFFHGITATCPGFYGPQGRKLRAPIAFTDLPEKMSTFRFDDLRITNFEMETSAIYGLGNILGHRCLSVNTVVANRVARQFSQDPKRAIENMIIRALEVLADSI